MQANGDDAEQRKQSVDAWHSNKRELFTFELRVTQDSNTLCATVLSTASQQIAGNIVVKKLWKETHGALVHSLRSVPWLSTRMRAGNCRANVIKCFVLQDADWLAGKSSHGMLTLPRGILPYGKAGM